MPEKKNHAPEKKLIEIAQQIRALSQNGLVYARDEYDIERYEELLKLSSAVTSVVTGHDIEVIKDSYKIQNDYTTPKVDIRAVVFNDNDEILLVRERADGCWSLPGGWADVGFSPKETAEKEVKEETGLNVKAVKLLAVMDKKCHDHPPAQHYAYKIFIQCEIHEGEFSEVFDILDKGFFKLNDLPPLSKERVLEEQLKTMYEYRTNPTKEAIVD